VGRDGRAPLAEAMRYSQIGMLIVVPMVVLGGIGYALDRRFGSQPWLLLAGLVVGMAAGFAGFLREVLSTPPPNGSGRKDS
jgi:F0F1-type ATP synthase assembly protein I